MTFLMHLRRSDRITAVGANTTYLDRKVKYGNKIVGYVAKAQPVDGGRAVRLTVEQTVEQEISDPSKLSLGGLR